MLRFACRGLTVWVLFTSCVCVCVRARRLAGDALRVCPLGPRRANMGHPHASPPPHHHQQQGCIGRGRGTPPPPLQGTQPYAQPLSPWWQVPPSMAFVTDSNRPQPLWQPPPTSGAASEVPSLLTHPSPPHPPVLGLPAPPPLPIPRPSYLCLCLAMGVIKGMRSSCTGA